MNPGFFHEVFAGNVADRQDVTEMFDGRCNRNRNDKENGLQVPLRKNKIGNGKPGGVHQGLEADQRGPGEIFQLPRIESGLDGAGDPYAVQNQRRDIPGHHTDQNGYQPEPAFAQQGCDNRRQQRHAGHDHGRFFRHQPGRAVTGPTHGHVNRHRRQHKTDHHDHRPHHDRRQNAVQKTGAESFDAEAQQDIEKPCGHQAAHGGRNAPCLNTVDDRCNERERGGQKNRHHPLGDELKDESTCARREKGHVGVQPRQERHEDQGAKGDKHHLGTDKAVFDSELVGCRRIVRGH